VTGFSTEGLIDIYFLKNLLPGYFWIFRLPGNKGNAGIFMPEEKILSKRSDLKRNMKDIIQHHPEISRRFTASKQISDIKGSLLPISGQEFKTPGNIYGKKFMLIGDAVGLVDPITGEGIGNAFTLAKFASEVIKKHFRDKGTDVSFREYGRMMSKKIGMEIFIHRTARYLFKNRLILELCFKIIKKCMKINSLIRLRLYRVNKN